MLRERKIYCGYMAEDDPRTFSDQERTAWFGFLAVHSLITRELDVLLVASHGLALVEFEVLLKLSIAGGRMRMSDLAEVALLSRSGLTRIVDELESLGLVVREPDEHDGRVLQATLTALGRRKFAAARKAHVADVRRLFLSRLTPEQRRGLGRGWEMILEGLEHEPVGNTRRAHSPAGVRARRVPPADVVLGREVAAAGHEQGAKR